MSADVAPATDDEAILAAVVECLVEVMGDEFLLDIELTPATRFSEDLAIESIEVVALGEVLQKRYGTQVNFASFISSKSLEEIVALTVGDVVSFVASVTGPAGVQAGGATHG